MKKSSFNRQQAIDGFEDCVEKIRGTRWNYWETPFGRNMSLCEPLPKNACRYIPDNPINFIDPSKSWLSNVIEIHRRFNLLLVKEGTEP